MGALQSDGDQNLAAAVSARVRSMLLLLLALGAPSPKPALDLGGRSFVPLRLAGLGQYGASPALFLEQERGGKVLPLPAPPSPPPSPPPPSPPSPPLAIAAALARHRNHHLLLLHLRHHLLRHSP